MPSSSSSSISVLNVAEKPSVARALASVFGRMPGSQERPMERRRDAAQIFTHQNVRFPSVLQQGNGQRIQGPIASHTMITTSVRGHLANHDFPQPQYGWSNCAPIDLFHAPIETTYRQDVQGLEQMLRHLSQRSTVLILWLDCDREGEAISDEVRTVCLEANTRLFVLRAKFSTVLPQEIQRALQTLGRVNEHFVQAVQARSQLDLRVGAAFTRFQTLRLQKKFDGFADRGVISYGPCQFPTLGFVVERWAWIQTFRPEHFWYLELTLRVPSSTTSTDGNNDATSATNINSTNTRPQPQARPIHFQWKRNRLYDRVVTMALYEECLEANEAVVIRKNTGRPKNKWRPVPLATVELQKRASRYLRISSETLMTAAEELYQQGYISYPRTETERFRPEFQHRPLIQEFSSMGGDFGTYATKLMTGNNFQNPRAGQHDDNAHPPITPCKAVDPQSIADATQRNVYILVVKHYLACCSRDARGEESQITVQIASEEFTAKGLMILEKNWLEIYAPWERWSTGQGELPSVQVGSRFTPSALLLKDGCTAAPQPISEVELISLMDRNGIGTDATIAQHIATILDREYAYKDQALKFHPTELGIALVEGYNSMGYQLNKPQLRREVEFECNQVALGRKTKEDIMGPILIKMKQCFERANIEAHKLDEAVARHFTRLGANNNSSTVLRANFSECGACGNLMELKQSNNNRGGNNRNGPPRKLLFCGSCGLGLALPKGDPQPMREANGAVKCPICQYQTIKIGRGDGYTGGGYNVCPKCFSDPPMEHGGVKSAEFRCFQCQHPTCSLASGTQGGDVEVYKCPFCPQGKVMLKRNSKGFVLSCSTGRQCSYIVWLPKESSTVSIPENQTCPACSAPGRQVRRVHFVWKPGSVPPHLDRECTVCVLCDAAFREEMRVNLPQRGQVQTTVRAPRGGSGRGRVAPNNRQGNNGGAASRGNVCYQCGQPGHFQSNCPRNRNRNR